MADLDQTLFIDRNNKHKSVQLTTEQVRQIRENPKNLTKEGAEFYLKIWRDESRNHVMAVFYDAFLHGRQVDIGDGRVEMVKCTNFSKPGFIKVDNFDSDGRRVYSRYSSGLEEGQPDMVESLERFKERVRFQESKKALKKEVEIK